MDWKRVKTILIFALVLVNIILGYTLFQDNEINKEEMLSLDLLIKDLASKDIAVTEELFDIEMSIPNISLTLQIYDVTSSDQVFRAASKFNNSSVDLVTAVPKGKELSFVTKFDRYDQAVMSDDDIKVYANQLIVDLGLSTDDIYLKEVGHTSKKTIFVYGQKVGGHIVRDAYMIIKYNNSNLLEFSRVWYDVVASDNIEEKFYEPEYALFKSLEKVSERFPDRQRALEVTNIELVYQLRQDTDQPSLSNLVVEGEASIFWQITTSDGEEYITDAIID